MCRQHVALYVGELDLDLGELGRAAITELLARGRSCTALPADAPPPWR